MRIIAWIVEEYISDQPGPRGRTLRGEARQRKHAAALQTGLRSEPARAHACQALMAGLTTGVHPDRLVRDGRYGYLQ